MTLRLILVCHAGTSAMRAGAFPADEPIDNAGAAKAAALARRLPRADRAWTSPALRARQTAAALGLDAAVEAALGQLDFGRWAGRPLAEIEAEEPLALAAWLADPATAPHGGEDFSAVLGRVTTWLDNCREETGRLVAVTHAAVILGRCHPRHRGVRALLRPYPRGTPRSPSCTRSAGRWRLRSLGPRR